MSALRSARHTCAAGVSQVVCCVLIATASGNSHGAEKIADFLARNWYVTEVIVMQRIPVMDVNSIERLIVLNPASLPNGMRTFFQDPDQLGAGYDLDPPTRAMLESGIAAKLAPIQEVHAIEATELTTGLDGQPPAIAPVVEPNPLLEFMALVGSYETQLEDQSYRWLPATGHLMARDVAILNRRRDIQVLLHGRWLQPVPGRDQPEPMLIQAGAKFAERYQLEGVLAVTLGRFLHFQAQLSYREPGLGQRPIDLPVSLTELPQNTPLPAPVPGAMVLNESRRMRSEEVHYLDHPKLGILVRIDPVTFPDDLIADFQALQEPIE